jgi:hypothetical protein
MGQFVRDPEHWLHRLSPDEWIRAALAEVKRAETAYARGDTRGGAASVKRAAGMGLNGALIVEPEERWGRSFVDHVQALSTDATVPEAHTPDGRGTARGREGRHRARVDGREET